MNCENCRNPLSENSTICEWCGNDTSKPNTQTPIVEKKKVNKKALKYTIYTLLFLACIIHFIFNFFIGRLNKDDFQIIYVVAPLVIIFEFCVLIVKFYTYLSKKNQQ